MMSPNTSFLRCEMRLRVACLVAGALLLAAPAPAASPDSGTLSGDSTTVTWSGGPFLVSNPLSCTTLTGTCDEFELTIVPPEKDFVVRVRISGQDQADDLDLFVRDPNDETIATSGTAGGVEEIVLRNPVAGTYTVVVQPFLVRSTSLGAYDGIATLSDEARDRFPNSYHGALYPPDFVGEPESRPARSSPLVPQLKVSFNPVGREAAEPTLGVNENNTAFFVAATFDSVAGGLARSLVLRSRDKGATWEPVSPFFLLQEEDATEPIFTLDPMLHVDPDGGVVDPSTEQRTGRVFSVDLYVGCSSAIFSDDEAVTWSRNPLACGQPVNDHHTIVTAPPPPGETTVGYPNMLYYCFNRVSDSSCGRSRDGGQTFEPAGTAFTGFDPDTGIFCGGLHGHLAGDSAGRLFLPKGHCGLPWVALSEDGALTWERVNIAGHTPMAHHEVSLGVDSADNLYAVWTDQTFRLPFLSVSRDHGRTWSTPLMVAPPGVHEVNFPTIVAGDPGRIALLFPGSESKDFDDPTRPWNLYVVVSVDALDDDPIFTWTSANDPADPVHRGDCGPGRCDAQDGGSMFDFLDIQLSPADGAFWGTASDTCVGECVTNPEAQKLRPGEGVAIRQTKGPLLLTTQ